MTTLQTQSTALAVIFMLFFSLNLIAQKKADDIDLTVFIKDTQKQQGGENKLKMAWWIPAEFWRSAAKQGGMVDDADLADLERIVSGYCMMAVVDGKMTNYGGMIFTDKELITESLVFTDQFNKKHRPIATEKLGEELQYLLVILKPMIQNMMGRLGENFHFYVFKDEENGQRLFDPYKEGKIHLKVLEADFEWATPLPSFMEPKMCPVDGEEMNGTWSYCPIHGKELMLSNKY